MSEGLWVASECGVVRSEGVASECGVVRIMGVARVNGCRVVSEGRWVWPVSVALCGGQWVWLASS